MIAKLRLQLNVPTNKIQAHVGEEEEEEKYYWEPAKTIKASIDTLGVFETWISPDDDKKMRKPQIRESLANFDKWLDDTVQNMVEEFKEKEKDIF